MARYVLLPRSRSISIEARQILIEQPGVQIVDECAGRALLVDATEDAAKILGEVLTNWIITRETVYPRPAATECKVFTKSENAT